MIEIRDSERAPHQANDFRYYARLGGKTQPIDHWLVMDIANRRRHPRLELSVEFKVVRRWKANMPALLDMPSLRGGGREIETALEAHFRLKNVGRVLVSFMRCLIWVPKELVHRLLWKDATIEVINDVEYVVFETDNIVRDVIKQGHSYIDQPEYGPSWYKRILPGMSHTWSWNWLISDMLSAYADNYLWWEVVADNAPADRGRIRVGDVAKSFTDKTKSGQGLT